MQIRMSALLFPPTNLDLRKSRSPPLDLLLLEPRFEGRMPEAEPANYLTQKALPASGTAAVGMSSRMSVWRGRSAPEGFRNTLARAQGAPQAPVAPRGHACGEARR